MKAPAAAGLKMCRPRTASRYFDAEANSAASAIASTATSSVDGGKMKKIR